MKHFLTLLILFVPSVVFAQAVAQPTYLDGILAFLAAHPAAGLSGIVAVVGELALRLWPSQKAMSLLVPVVYGLDGVKGIAGWLGDVLRQLVALANNTVPPKQ